MAAILVFAMLYVTWCSFLSCRKSKAKPNGKKPAAEEKKMYLEPEYTKSRITDFEFKELVVLPREIDLNEWLASNSAWGCSGRGGAGVGGVGCQDLCSWQRSSGFLKSTLVSLRTPQSWYSAPMPQRSWPHWRMEHQARERERTGLAALWAQKGSGA